MPGHRTAYMLGYKASPAAVMKLARRYQDQIESFGQIRLEIRLNKQGKPTEYALLNERQAAFLVELLGRCNGLHQVHKFVDQSLTNFG